MIKCKICERECKNSLSLCRHTKMKHNIKILEYHMKYENFNIPICLFCNNHCEYKNGLTFKKICNTKECILKYRTSFKHTDETKIKLSKLKKEFLKNNPDKHPWKNSSKHKSIPCQRVKDYLTKNKIEFIDEYQPLEDRFFCIDIAFPDKMIGIEINGNQHYDKGILKPYYQNRHDLIEKKGWTIYEFHYVNCYKEDFLNKLKSLILDGKQQVIFDYKTYAQPIKKNHRKYGNRKKYSIAIKNKYEHDQQKYIPLLLDSDIDFSKFGWVAQVSVIINQKPQKVHKWMKRIMPNFYETKCFKRNASASEPKLH